MDKKESTIREMDGTTAIFRTVSKPMIAIVNAALLKTYRTGDIDVESKGKKRTDPKGG